MNVSPETLNQVRARAAAFVELRALRARTNFSDFVTFCINDEAGRPFDLEPLHLAWHRHVTWCWKRSLHAGIQAPWGHGKSAGLVVPLSAWLIGANPNLRIKIVCSSKELAVERVGAIKTVLTSPQYRHVFPHVRQGGRWTADEVTVARSGLSSDPTLQAKSVFGKGVGKRADVLIFDDVVDQINSLEPGQRKKVRDVTSNTWMSRLTPQGRVLWIATPWHTDDATMHIMTRPNWAFLIQSVNEEVTEIDQTVHGVGLDYLA